MALTGLHTNWENVSYTTDRNQFLKEHENPILAGGGSYGLTPYFDGSIAIGYGYDLLVHTNAQINSLLTSMGMPSLSTADATRLDQARAQVRAGTATTTYLRDDVANQLTLTLPNEAAAETILATLLNQYETALDTALGGHNQLPDSKERIAILSLLYTMVDPVASKISSKIPSTIAAIQNDNRAEAWYEIRYNSNGGSSKGQGIANRRYTEADLFGLYDEAAGVNDTQARDVYRMYTQHSAAMKDYDALYGGTTSLIQALTPAATLLNNTYAQGQTFSPLNIWVSALNGSHLQSTGDKAELFIGDGGSDLIQTGAGQDELYGGNGTDRLIGGKGNDGLTDGAGNDSITARFGIARRMAA